MYKQPNLIHGTGSHFLVGVYKVCTSQHREKSSSYLMMSRSYIQSLHSDLVLLIFVPMLDMVCVICIYYLNLRQQVQYRID